MYQSRWTTPWVIRLYHNYRIFLLVWVLASFSLFAGLLFVDRLPKEFELVLLSMGLMALASAKLMDSVKTALLLVTSGAYVFTLLLGVLGWLSIPFDETSALGWVVLMTLVYSNLIHFLAALHREMARGIYQQEAISEALMITHQPILLSTLTTALGFGVVGYFNQDFEQMAWVVVLGALISYLFVLFALPMLLLKHFLEFRVGNYEDRHGLSRLMTLFQKRPYIKKIVVILAILITAIAMVILSNRVTEITSVVMMFLITTLLLMIFWKNLFVPLLAMGIGLISLLWVVGVYAFWTLLPILSLLMVVPLGILLDDLVHFFTRYIRAENYYLVSASDRIQFALKSVGRPLWLTSLLLVLGLSVLLLSDQELVRDAAFITMLSVIFTSFLLLIVFPSLVTGQKR